MHVLQILMSYTRNLHSAACQLISIKSGRKKVIKFFKKEKELQIPRTHPARTESGAMGGSNKESGFYQGVQVIPRQHVA